MDEETWRDRRTDELEDRKRVILSGGYVWPADDRPGFRYQAHPRRTDWYRVAALLLVFLTAGITFAGVWLALVAFLTAF